MLGHPHRRTTPLRAQHIICVHEFLVQEIAAIQRQFLAQNIVLSHPSASQELVKELWKIRAELQKWRRTL